LQPGLVDGFAYRFASETTEVPLCSIQIRSKVDIRWNGQAAVKTAWCIMLA
jgi:hypothetical protein